MEVALAGFFTYVVIIAYFCRVVILLCCFLGNARSHRKCNGVASLLHAVNVTDHIHC